MRTHVLTSMKVTDVSKCRLRARTSVYWPGVNDDISDLVGQCETCQLSQLKNQKELLVSVENPKYTLDKTWCRSM